MDLYYGLDSKNSQNAYKIASIVIDELSTKLGLKVYVEEVDDEKTNILCDDNNNIIFKSDSPLALYHFLKGMLIVKK